MVSSSDNLQSPNLGGMAVTARRNDVVVQNASWSGTALVSVTCMSRQLYAQEVRIPERSGFLATVLSRADRPASIIIRYRLGQAATDCSVTCPRSRRSTQPTCRTRLDLAGLGASSRTEADIIRWQQSSLVWARCRSRNIPVRTSDRDPRHSR